MLPKRVAELANKEWGFVTGDDSGRENSRKEEIFQDSKKILAYFKLLPLETQNNGIWVVLTHPDAYSEPERQAYESLKQMCLKNNIKLFVCRGSRLPDGWVKGNLFSIANCEIVYSSRDAVESGWNYFRQGNSDAALKEFNRAWLIDPDFAPAHFGKAYIYSTRKKLDLAINSYKKSIEKDPTDIYSYSNLGLTLINSDKLEEGFSILKKALEIDSQIGEVHVNIAFYYYCMQDWKNAWKHVHFAQRLGQKIDPLFLKDLNAEIPEPRESK